MKHHERIVDVNIVEQSRDDLMQYAIYVARMRAIPDIRDGLKPVIRRIIWCAGHDFRGQGFSKTAAVMGQVIRKYNPHGDSSVQGAIRNMVNDFSTKYPTMLGSGAWGSKANPTEAAARYTDCKISNFSVDVFIQDLYDYGKKATDWVPTYDNKDFEPLYFPAKVPMLLINGQVGIGVGFKTSIPSHNLGEVVDVTIKLIKNPKAKFCLVPDECMRCELIDTDWQKINDTGIGTYIAQGVIDTGTYNNHPALFVRSLPDFTYFLSVKDNITDLVEKGKMPYIIDMVSRTKTDISVANVEKRNGVFEEVIILKKGTDPNFVKEFLYNNTAIRQTRQVRLLVIKNNNLVPINYREYLLDFINERRTHIFRLLNVKLQKLKTEVHERELYLKAMTSGEIDNIIDMIRKKNTTDDSELVEYLCNKLRVTDLQARFLLNTNIKKLSKGYMLKYQRELKELTQEINNTMAILTNPERIDDIIIEQMLEIKRKYNNERKCYVISKSQANGIAPGTFKIIFTKNNMIKKIGEHEEIPPHMYPIVKFVMLAENEEDLIMFSELGKVYKLPVHKIPLSDRKSDGIDIRVLIKNAVSGFCCAARATTLEKLSRNKMHSYIFVVTRMGYIKKIDIADVLTAPPSGIIYSKLDEGDVVKSIIFGPDKLDLMVYSANKALRISPKDVPYLKRSTKGNRASTPSSLIDGIDFIVPNQQWLIMITKNGYISKISLKLIKKSSRGKAGAKCCKLMKGDAIVAYLLAKDNDNIMVFDNRKEVMVNVKDVKETTTVSAGIKLFNNPLNAILI